jgi:hypothetical protein
MSRVSWAMARWRLLVILQGPDIVDAIGQFDQNDSDVVGHGQQHFTDILRLPGLGAGKLKGAQLGDAGNNMQHLGPEHLENLFFGGMGVFDHIMEQSGRNADGIQFHVRQNAGHFEGMGEIGFARKTHLAVVDLRRKDVGAIHQTQIGIRTVLVNLINNVADPDHRRLRCRRNGSVSHQPIYYGLRRSVQGTRLKMRQFNPLAPDGTARGRIPR